MVRAPKSNLDSRSEVKPVCLHIDLALWCRPKCSIYYRNLLRTLYLRLIVVVVEVEEKVGDEEEVDLVLP